jgi:hypothetical protein
MKKLPKFVKISLLILSIIGIFFAGVSIGFQYHDFDVLCETKPKAYILKKALYSDNGIYLPKGTVVPLQECKNADRFVLKFYLSHLPENVNVFLPYEAKTKEDKTSIMRESIYYYGLEVK